jgi:hypothetical protein
VQFRKILYTPTTAKDGLVTFEEAISGSHSLKWIEAMGDELQSVKDNRSGSCANTRRSEIG